MFQCFIGKIINNFYYYMYLKSFACLFYKQCTQHEACCSKSCPSFVGKCVSNSQLVAPAPQPSQTIPTGQPGQVVQPSFPTLAAGQCIRVGYRVRKLYNLLQLRRDEIHPLRKKLTMYIFHPPSILFYEKY